MLMDAIDEFYSLNEKRKNDGKKRKFAAEGVASFMIGPWVMEKPVGSSKNGGSCIRDDSHLIGNVLINKD